eukprot:jgi/Tetstr1/447775/TSEL_035105.t1
MHNGDTFALDVVRELFLRHGTENPGSPEIAELHDSFKNARPARETTALRTTFAKDVTKDYAIIDMKRALQIRHLKTIEELRRAPLPCDVNTDILDNIAALPTTTTDYKNIFRDGTAICFLPAPSAVS